MVESGVERVTEGIHTRPTLDDGAGYRLTVVCVGKGEAEIAFSPAGAARGGWSPVTGPSSSSGSPAGAGSLLTSGAGRTRRG